MHAMERALTCLKEGISMNCKAMIVTDGSISRVIFLQSKVLVGDDGNEFISRTLAHREIPAPTKEAAVRAASSIGVNLSREVYAETGSKPVTGAITVVGTFGSPASLPKVK